MPEFSHPTFGSVGRFEQPEVPTKQLPVVEEVLILMDDLQSLIECGKITDEIIIDGRKFQMSTLADEDQEAIFKKFSSAMADAGSFVELRRTVVAMSINTMNGRPLESLYPPDAPGVDIFGAKLALVRKMQGPVLDKLYEFYEELLKRSKQKVEPEQIKNS